MRNYIEMFLFTFHASMEFVGEVDGEVWCEDEDELWNAIAHERSEWEGAGWTFEVTWTGATFWKLSKSLFSDLVKGTSQSVNWVNPADPQDVSWNIYAREIIKFKSPRGQEKRKFKLVPLQK